MSATFIVISVVFMALAIFAIGARPAAVVEYIALFGIWMSLMSIYLRLGERK